MADLQNAFERLNALIKRKNQALTSPGLAIGVTDRDQLLFAGTYGMANREAEIPVTPETLFQIGSISKSFASIALLQLQEEGRLHIDDPVTRHLPWFEIQSAFAPITLRHLMSHTAGIITGTEETPTAFTEAWNLRHTRATAAPGEMFHYSNSGYKILGLVLEAISGQPASKVLRQRVFAPLGMKASEPAISNTIRPALAVGYQPFYDDRPFTNGGLLAPAPWFESDTADGAICSHAEDMCRYLRALLNQGAGLLTPQGFKELITPMIRTEDGQHGEHYGLGLFTQQLRGNHIISHSGGMVGYQAHLMADLDAGIGVVTLTNTPYDPIPIAHWAWESLVSVLKGEAVSGTGEADPYAVKNGERYAGGYRNDKVTFRLIYEDEYLYMAFERDRILLEPAGLGVFLVPHPTFELFPLRFEPESNPEGDPEVQVSEAFHGADIYLREGSNLPGTTSYPNEWEAFPGHYRSHNPWLNNFRVVLRNGRLILIEPQGYEERLYPIEPGYFRLGSDPRSPEFIQFNLIHDGKAMQAKLTGGAYSRIFSP